MKILYVKCEDLKENCVTDEKSPRFSFAATSERENDEIKNAVLRLNGSEIQSKDSLYIAYKGEKLKPFTRYEATGRKAPRFLLRASSAKNGLANGLPTGRTFSRRKRFRPSR